MPFYASDESDVSPLSREGAVLESEEERKPNNEPSSWHSWIRAATHGPFKQILQDLKDELGILYHPYKRQNPSSIVEVDLGDFWHVKYGIN